MNLVYEQNILRMQIGQYGRQSPLRSMAGPEVMRMLTPISIAMMLASVVLPRPGGP
jgi:hypothetical protein